MSDTLEQAAQAFDTAINGNASPRRESDSSTERPTETMFAGVGDLEVDENSPVRGGGDDEDRASRRETNGRFRRQEEENSDDADEAGNEEDEDNQGVDEDADDEDAGKDDEDADDVYEVVVDGQRIEVPLREALNGYIRTETFHQRLNQVNEAAKVVSGRYDEVEAMRTEYVGLIDKMKKGIEALVPSGMNWDELYAQDPKAARELENRYNGFKDLLKGLDVEKASELKKQEDEKSKKNREDVAAENARIMRNNPTWKDPKVMARDQAMMANTAQRAGYSIEEVAGITDSRQVTILLKAAKWDKLQGDRPKPIRKGVKPGQRGAVNGNGRSASRADKGAMKQLSRTGSLEDAASVFTNLIK